MGKVQLFLLAAVIIGITVLMLATWGSIGSILCAFLLVIVVAAVLYRKFVLERDDDMFDWDL